jgi:hypothetical protein
MSKSKRKPGRPVVSDPRVSRRVGLSKSEEARILRAAAIRGKEFSPLARELLLAWSTAVEIGGATLLDAK